MHLQVPSEPTMLGEGGIGGGLRKQISRHSRGWSKTAPLSICCICQGQGNTRSPGLFVFKHCAEIGAELSSKLEAPTVPPAFHTPIIKEGESLNYP